MSTKAEKIERLSRQIRRYRYILAAQVLAIAAGGILFLTWEHGDSKTAWAFLAAIVFLLASVLFTALVLRRHLATIKKLESTPEDQHALVFGVAAAGLARLTIPLFATLITGSAGLVTGTATHINKYMTDSSYVRYLKDNTKSVDDRVRYAISIEAGAEPPNIGLCPPERPMKELIPDQATFGELTGLLNVIVNANPHTAVCSINEITHAPKVKDCITIVKGKITH
jgi:hypothetical protein